MKIRVITSVIALAVFIAVLLAPPIVFTIALAGVILVMLYECYSATKANVPMKIVGFVSAIIAMVMVYINNIINYDSFTQGSVFGMIMLIVLMHMILVVIEHGKKSYKDILANGFLTLYITLSVSCIWLMKERFSTSVMLIIFICAWSTDTFAYFSGKLFGKHKLIPNVSPNKTVEGAIGGVICAMVISVAYLFVIKEVMNLDIIIWSNVYVQGAIIGLIGGVFSQIGDLIASSIKRDTGIKDFGWIFPGHGGFMDRFDSVIFIAPIIYCVTTFLMPFLLIIIMEI